MNNSIKSGIQKCIEQHSPEEATEHIFQFMKEYVEAKEKEIHLKITGK